MNRRTFLASLTATGTVAAVPGGWLDWLQGKGTGPADILIIRHAEEEPKGPHLDSRGRQRADALIKLFNGRFAKPTAIFAAKTSNESSRPVETVQPLAANLGLPINDDFKDDRYESLAQLILHDSRYDHAHVLICWHQGTIPELARTLGATSVPRWSKQDYDGIWVLKYAMAGGKPTLTAESQHLLSGDRGK